MREKTMTRHDLNRLAKGLRQVKPVEESQRRGWRAAVEAVADYCAGCNPRFDRTRFVATCYGALSVGRVS